MRLYIVRHGETPWNTQLRLQGQTDIPLNENGRALARETARALMDVPFDLALTSPLSRARETAELLLAGRDIPIIDEERIREISFGTLEGVYLSREERENPDSQFYRFFHEPDEYAPPEGGESVRALCERTEAFLEELKTKTEWQDKIILVSTHGAASRALLLGMTHGETKDLWADGVPKNCAITIAELSSTGDEWVILEKDKIYYDPDNGRNQAPDYMTGDVGDSENVPDNINGRTGMPKNANILPETSTGGSDEMPAKVGLKTADFYFDLPQELIAQDPLEDRSASRLLVLDKKTGAIQHRHFRDVLEYLHPGDCLVLNNTRVIPARLYGVREGTGAMIEILLLKRKENNIWETLVKPGKKAKPGTRILFGDGILTGEVIDVVEEGNRLIQFTYEGVFEEILDRLGQMPLPPYITHELKDKNRYQTVYAKYDGSAAAPTAGLHFTPELLEQVRAMGVRIAEVTLHVGLGTFRPVKVEDVTKHHMHSEFYQIDEDAARVINETKASGGRVICVGTTSCRTIESAAADDEMLTACSGWTEIFIYPGYRFKVLDGLITNFHLPESTLLMLVSALAGREHILNAYAEAVRERYRFFSFGDAMLII